MYASAGSARGRYPHTEDAPIMKSSYARAVPSPEQRATLRQESPDWIKGLAITLMVYGHIAHIGSLSLVQKQLVDLIYTFHMPLFLIVAGFFFHLRLGPLDTLRKTLSRVARPYLIFISLYNLGLIAIQQVGVPTSNTPPGSLEEFVDVVILRPRGGYWFLHSLVLIQAALAVSGYVGARLNHGESTYLVVGLCVLSMICGFGILSPRTVAYFMLGIVLGRLGAAFPASGVLGGVLIAATAVLEAGDIFRFSIIQIAWCLSIALFLGGVGSYFGGSPIVMVFAWIGRNSITILVLHALFVVMLKPLAPLFLQVEPSGVAYSVFVVTATLPGCMLIGKCLDRGGMSRFCFGTRTIYSRIQSG